MFTVSIQRSHYLVFVCWSTRMLVCLRRLLRWSHLRSSSERSLTDLPLREGPVFAFLKCDVTCSRRTTWKTVSWIDSPLREASSLDVSEDEWEMLRQNWAWWAIQRVSQWMHLLYWSFYVNMKNQHFFSWSRCYLGGFVQMTLFSLSIRVHALWMCYNEQSLYLYLKKKKKQLPKDIKIHANA